MRAYGDDTLMSAGEEPQPGGEGGNLPLTGSEQFVKELHNEKLTKFHTEINWPAPMTGLDVLRMHYRMSGMTGAAKYLDTYCEWFRTNMVPYKRKREQVIAQIGAAQAAAREQTKSMQELLLGRAMK